MTFPSQKPRPGRTWYKTIGQAVTDGDLVHSKENGTGTVAADNSKLVYTESGAASGAFQGRLTVRSGLAFRPVPKLMVLGLSNQTVANFCIVTVRPESNSANGNIINQALDNTQISWPQEAQTADANSFTMGTDTLWMVDPWTLYWQTASTMDNSSTLTLECMLEFKDVI